MASFTTGDDDVPVVVDDGIARLMRRDAISIVVPAARPIPSDAKPKARPIRVDGTGWPSWSWFVVGGGVSAFVVVSVWLFAIVEEEEGWNVSDEESAVLFGISSIF